MATVGGDDDDDDVQVDAANDVSSFRSLQTGNICVVGCS